MDMDRVHIYHDKVGAVEYVQHMGDEMTIVNAARVSYGRHKTGELDERDKKLISYLLSSGHTSVLEHNVITFRFTVPLFVRGQHHRHRTWSYNEISRRYTDEDFKFYCPPVFRGQHESNRQGSTDEWSDPLVEGSPASEVVDNLVVHAFRTYHHLLDAGVAREMARMVLPQNMYTEYYGTVNLNNLIKFLDLRLDSHAQWEIRKVAMGCLIIAKQVWPQVIGPMLMERYNKLPETPYEIKTGRSYHVNKCLFCGGVHPKVQGKCNE